MSSEIFIKNFTFIIRENSFKLIINFHVHSIHMIIMCMYDYRDFTIQQHAERWITKYSGQK